MAPLVAPNVVRYTVNGTYAGSNIANIFDVRVRDYTVPADRLTFVTNQARDILHAWDDRILPIVVNDYVATSVSWVDLNDEQGSTGIVTTGGGDTWPKAGATTATGGLPANVAALVTKVAPGGGRSTRNGRTYLVGLSEGATDLDISSNLNAVSQAAVTTAMEGFSSDVSNTFLSDGYTSNIVVVHTRNMADAGDPPDIVVTGTSDVTAMVCQSRLATQRRRLRK